MTSGRGARMGVTRDDDADAEMPLCGLIIMRDNRELSLKLATAV